MTLPAALLLSPDISAPYLPPEYRNMPLLAALCYVWALVLCGIGFILLALYTFWPAGPIALWERLWLQFEGNVLYVVGWAYAVAIITNLLTLIAWLLYKLVPWQEY